MFLGTELGKIEHVCKDRPILMSIPLPVRRGCLPVSNQVTLGDLEQDSIIGSKNNRIDVVPEDFVPYIRLTLARTRLIQGRTQHDGHARGRLGEEDLFGVVKEMYEGEERGLVRRRTVRISRICAMLR